MASLQTRINIWNAALDWLREQPLSSIDDVTATAHWLTRNYAQQRDYLLERYLWKFALTRVAVPADPAPPAFGWSYRYAIPPDALRIVPPTYDGSFNGTPIPYEVGSGYLMCNVTAPLRLSYIARASNEGQFSNGFCEVLSIRLAVRMSHWLTGKASLTATLQDAYKETLDEVRQVEALQVVGGSYYDRDILDDMAV